MKEFMKTNTITHNLMSFTGFKSMFIFSLLLQGPQTYEQIKYALEHHEYLSETVSIDTIRIYINSLEKFGFKINRTRKNHKVYFSIEENPFELKITTQQADSILKVYKIISKSITLDDYIALQQFFEKFSQYINNEELKEKFKNLSPLANIDSDIVNDLILYTRHKNIITVVYNSKKSGIKDITILADSLQINNNKLYLYGYNYEHENYFSFPVSNILKIKSVNIKSEKIELETYRVIYELTKSGVEPELYENEKILNEDNKKYTIEISSKNKFDIIQRILYYSNRCTVIEPVDFRQTVISHLKKMKEGYGIEKE